MVIVLQVAVWLGAWLAIARSHVQISLMTTVYKNTNSGSITPVSVNEYQRKLVSKWAYHAMHGPCIYMYSLAAWASDRLRANEMEIGAAL